MTNIGSSDSDCLLIHCCLIITKAGIDIAVQTVKQCCCLREQIRADILLCFCAKQLFSGNIFYGIKGQLAALRSETGTIYIGTFRVRLHGITVFQRGVVTVQSPIRLPETGVKPELLVDESALMEDA